MSKHSLMKTLNCLTKILIITALISLCSAETILKDLNFPVTNQFSVQLNNGRKLQLRFQLQTRVDSTGTYTAKGLGFNQYIGVRFPNTFTNLSAAGSFGCSLSSTTTLYSVLPVNPVAADSITFSGRPVETNVAYCMLNDTINNWVPVGVVLTLTITFPVDMSKAYIENIGLFTSTTNNPDQYIIDSNPSMGSLLLYSDYVSLGLNDLITLGPASDATQNYNHLNIFTVTSPSNMVTSNVIYPYFTININVSLRVSEYWAVEPQDYLVYFKYNTNTFSGPSSIATTAFSTLRTESNLVGRLTYTQITDGIIISGFDMNDLYPNRVFNLQLLQMAVLNKTIGQFTNLELFVYYKNTYSIISYSKLTMPPVNKIPLTTSVQNPDGFYVFDGMGWPFLFSIATPTDIVGGGYVVIRSSYKFGSVNVQFVASTCDFSQNTTNSVDSSFGKYNPCFALNNGFVYDTTTTLASSTASFTEGHGFYFKMATLSAKNGAFYVKIWGFVDVCYLANATSTTLNSTNLNFTVRIFLSAQVNDTILNEKIFFSGTNILIADSLSSNGTITCYPLQTRTDSNATYTNAVEISKLPTGVARMTSDFITNAAQPQAVGIEINNMYLGKPTVANMVALNATANQLFLSYTATTEVIGFTGFTPYYIIGTDLPGSALTIFGIIRATNTNAAFNIVDYLPTECYSAGADGNRNYFPATYNPNIEWHFSKDLFTAFNSYNSSPGCQVSWYTDAGLQQNTSTLYYGTGVYNAGASIINNYKTTILSFDTQITATSTKTTTLLGNMNLIATNITTSGIHIYSNLITYNPIPSAAGNAAITVISLSLLGQLCTTTRNASNTGAVTAGAFAFGVYSDCIKWNTITDYKSIYTPFEIQGVFSITVSGVRMPWRVIRFIKLFPELDVFQSKTSMDSVTDSNSIFDSVNSKWVVNHYEATTSAYSPFSVCIIELQSRYINVFRDTLSDTLIIWLFATSLLDLDPVTSVGEYPVAPLGTSVKAYGFNSGQTIGFNFRRIGDTTSATQQYPNIMATTGAALSELEYYYHSTVLLYNPVNAAGNIIGTLGVPGFSYSRTLYHFFLGSVIYIRTSSSPSTTNNLYIPYKCPIYSNQTSTSVYPANGIYWINPIITVAWGEMTNLASVKKINRYVRPTVFGGVSPHSTNAFPISSQTVENFGINGTTDYYQRFFFKQNIASVTSTTVQCTPVQFPLYRSKAFVDDSILTANPRVNTNATTRSYNFLSLQLNFNAYTNTVNTTVLNYLNLSATTPPTSANSTNVSAIAVFLNSTFGSLSTTVSSSFGTGTQNFLNQVVSSPTYIMGIPFTNFLVTTMNANSTTQLTSNLVYSATAPLRSTNTQTTKFFTISNTPFTITGIPRLALTSYPAVLNPSFNPLTNNKYYINNLDYIASFTSRYAQSWNTGGTNDNLTVTNLLIPQDSPATFVRFLLYWPAVDNTAWTNSVIDVDVTGNSISSDKAGNLKIQATMPTTIPVGGLINIQLTSSVLYSSSICGFMETGYSTATTCTITNSLNINCQLNVSTATLNICCYNIFNQNGQIDAKSGQVTLPYDMTTTTLTSYPGYAAANILYLYPLASQTTSLLATKNFSTRQVTNLSTVSDFYTKLININYTISTSNMGIGAATFQFSLPRAATRGMTLIATVNLSGMKIANITPIITASFGNSQLYNSSPDQGDIFIQNVYTNLDSAGIKLNLKNILYKCKLDLSSTLFVNIWPVVTLNYPSLAITSITMRSPDGTDLALSTAHTVTSTPNFTVNAINTTPASSFVSLTSIDPPISEEYAVYNFSLSFSQTSSSLSAINANEICVFAGNKFFNLDGVLCYQGSTLLQCNLVAKNFLCIRFSSSIKTTGDSAVTFQIAGIMNPYLPNQSGEFFLVVVNSTDYLNAKRQTLVYGTATYTAGIVTSSTTVYSNLIFKNNSALTFQSFTNLNTGASSSLNNSSNGFIVFESVPLNPRENPELYDTAYRTIHSFGFTFDIADYMLNIDNNYTMINSPQLYVTFPPEYQLQFAANQPNADINCYKYDQNTDKSLVLTNILTINTVSLVGNLVKITFNETSFTINKLFQYCVLEIYRIPPPNDTTNVSVTNQMTTQNYKLLLFNSDYSMIFRTWTNLNNFSNIGISQIPIDQYLTNNKGLPFTYDQTKWVIDIISGNNTILTPNYIQLYSGRYTLNYIKRRSESRNLEPVRVDILIKDTAVKLLQPTYSFGTYINGNVPFQIGLDCNVDPQIRWLFFDYKSSNLANPYFKVLPMAPVYAMISNTILGTITFPQTSIVRISGSTFIDFTVAEPPFADISITFTTSTESIINNSKILAGTNTTRTVMRVLSATAVNIQTFTMGSTSNACYQFQFSTISFTIDGVVAIIPNDAIKPAMFVYKNSLNDSTLKKNSVSFTFTSEYTQIYLYAALVCLNLDFPSDASMKTGNITTSSDVNYYSNLIFVTTNTGTVIVFPNLIRGTPYKLKVLIESTQGDSSLRTSSSLVITTFNTTTGSVPIMANISTVSQCVSYNFVTRPGKWVTDALLYRWQYELSSNGYYEGGCLTAVDQYGTNIPGMPDLTKEIVCGSSLFNFVNYTQYIVNQTQLSVPETYVICAYPLPSCQFDPAQYPTKISSIMTALSNNVTSGALLNIRVIPAYNMTLVDNTVVPTQPTLTNLVYSSGVVTFQAQSTNPQICSIMFSSASSVNATSFNNCQNCYSVNVGSTLSSYQININQNLQNGNYKPYAICQNNSPVTTTKTNVLSFSSSFTIGQPTTPTNNTTTTPNNTKTNTTNSYFMKLNFALVLLYLLALLI